MALTLSDFLSEYFAQTQNYTAQWLLDTISLNYTEDATPLTNLIDGGNMLLADQQLTNDGDVGSWGDVVSSQVCYPAAQPFPDDRLFAGTKNDLDSLYIGDVSLWKPDSSRVAALAKEISSICPAR